MLSVSWTYTEDDRGSRGGPGDLDHGEDLGHLTLAGASVKQSAAENMGNFSSVGLLP